VAAILATTAAHAHFAAGQTAWYEGFEGPDTTWRDAGGNGQYRLELHQRTRQESHTGKSSERLRIAGSGATQVYMAHDVARARVIEELRPIVWIKSDRPGLQILARVVLPRTNDPRTGRPVSTSVQGTSYNKVGHWQQLCIDDIPQLLTRQARLLRTELGPNVDAREAYVDQILLNVYGGPGVTNVWIDDLDIAGCVGPVVGSTEVSGAGGESGWHGSSSRESQLVPPADNALPQVKLVGSVLLVDDRPMSARMIEYQGESLAYLKELGFNTVWLKEPATDRMLDEAGRLGLWLVCPPPYQPRLEESHGRWTPPAEIGPQYAPVLAWDLGRGLSTQELPLTRQWAEQVRSADRRRKRPLICRPDSDLRGYSRYVDLLMLGRSPLGTSLELTDYATWLRQRPRLARPGTPVWSTVQTQPDERLHGQWNAAGRGRSLPPELGPDQIRMLAYTAVAAGSRGLLFESRSPLDATDPASRNRAAALELLNVELELIRPWLAASSFVATVRGSEPEVLGAVLRTDRARLLIPLWTGPAAQLVPGQSAADMISFVVPGVPESNNAYQLTPGGLRPLRHKRVTGGVSVTLEEFSPGSFVLLTQDPLVVNSLTRHSATIARRAAELQRRLAAWKLQIADQVSDRLSADSAAGSQLVAWLTAARQSLQRCDGYLAARDYQVAWFHGQRASRVLRLLERSAWQEAAGRLGSPVATPATACFPTLPWQKELVGRISKARAGPNQLAGGDFEDLQRTLASGWRHFQHPEPDIRVEADLTPAAARSGRLGLRLFAHPTQPDCPPTLVETPPVWITSPAVPVEAGSWVCIHGWVQVPTAVTGSVDGLLVVDSLTGEALAERIGQTIGWQEFRLYRVAPQAGSVTVTFVLSGLGEALLDDVSIRPLGSLGASAAAGFANPMVRRLPDAAGCRRR